MKKNLLKAILDSGINDQHSIIERRRVKLLNFFTLFSAILLTVLISVNIGMSLYKMVLVDVGAFLFILIPVFLLNRQDKYKIAAGYFIVASIFIVCLGSIIAYSEHRFTGTENILLLSCIMSIIMIDSFYQVVLYAIASFLLLLMKYLKLGVFSDASFNEILMTQINIITIILAIYFFMRVFKEMLVKAIEVSENQEATLYSLIDNTPLHLGLVDRDWKYVIVNSNYERSFGFPRKDIIGKHASEILPDELFNRHKSMIEDAFLGESPEFGEQSTLPNGSTFFAQGKYAPVFDAQGKISGATVYVANVSELKKTEEKLQKALKHKDKLFSIIAHDIISPLNLFQNILAIKDDDIMDKKSFFEYQDTIQKKLLVLNNTINNLLQWARAQQKEINAYPKKVFIKHIVEENLTLFEELSKMKNLRIEQSLDDIQAFIDEDHLKLIIRNLIHNAIKFSNESGKIKISSKSSSSNITFCIQDFGIGLTDDKIARIFDNTSHFSEAGTAGEIGTGLGLSLCLELAKLNNCEFKIKSIPNEETRVEVSIPLHESQVVEV